MSDLLKILGIGKTFVRDFSRINVFSIDDLAGRNPDNLYKELCRENQKEAHKTSKKYLYVIRMAVYFANGGREKEKLVWNVWKDVT